MRIAGVLDNRKAIGRSTTWIYSCFPSAVQIAATELGIPEGRPLTVTEDSRSAWTAGNYRPRGRAPGR
jgi:hypothetical protein